MYPTCRKMAVHVVANLIAALFVLHVCLVAFSKITTTTAAFVVPPVCNTRRPGNNLHGGTTIGGGGGGGGRGVHNGGSGGGGNDGGNDDFGRSLSDSSNDPPSLWSSFSNWANLTRNEQEEENDEDDNERAQETVSLIIAKWNNSTETMRGGATRRGNNPDQSNVNIQSTKPASSVSKRIKGIFRGKAKRQQDELMQQLQTMPIRRVQVPNTTVLPDSVIQSAAIQAGMMGQPLRSDRVQDFARYLTSWYQQQGYVLHSVTGATLRPETATAEITVQEPILHQEPVGIVFVKEMVVDPKTGEMLTPRQYRDRQHSITRKSKGFPMSFGDDTNQDLDVNHQVNTTFVAIDHGRTRPSRIARALQLKPGQHFQWQGSRWMKIRESGIFGRVIQTAPQAKPDGTVQLQIVATEAPTRHLEYGVGKSLYTGSWEGELDFEHGNLLGGGEVLGLSVRRGTHDAEPSVHVRFSDDRFGMEGGYDIEVFSDYIGDAVEGGLGGSKVRQMKNFFQRKKSSDGDSIEAIIEEEESSVASTTGVPTSFDEDSLHNRQGATFRLQNPVDQRVMWNSIASASVEQAKTKHGFYEGIASASLGVGPIVHDLLLGTRADIDARLIAGTRVSTRNRDAGIQEDDVNGGALSTFTSRVMPYLAVTATTRQIVPIRSIFKRPILLALKHSVITSTKTLPRHEARAQGHSCKIRGMNSSGAVSSAFLGTTELRIPIQLPIPNLEQDASVLVFGDWRFSKEHSSSPIERRSSVGLGLRKTLQGIPVQCNVCYSNEERRIRTTFGLGRDFMV